MLTKSDPREVPRTKADGAPAELAHHGSTAREIACRCCVAPVFCFDDMDLESELQVNSLLILFYPLHAVRGQSSKVAVKQLRWTQSATQRQV